MFEVTVQADFSSGHYLRNYHGKCENPYLDHQMINDLEPFTTLNPSAENLAKYFFDKTAGELHALTAGRVCIKDCTLYETDTSFARYYL